MSSEEEGLPPYPEDLPPELGIMPGNAEAFAAWFKLAGEQPLAVMARWGAWNNRVMAELSRRKQLLPPREG